VALSQRVRTLAGGLDDGWLVFTACFMVDDLYKSYFYQFRWDRAVHDYIAATAGVVVGELVRRGFVLHYVVDSTQPEAELDEKLTYIPAVFEAADLFVTGPQLMALELMQQLDHRPRDVTAIPLYRGEGHKVADELIAALSPGAPVFGVSESGPRRRHPGAFSRCGVVTQQHARHHRRLPGPAPGCRLRGSSRPAAGREAPGPRRADLGERCLIPVRCRGSDLR